MSVMYFGLFALAALGKLGQCSYSVPFVEPDNCRSSEFFDVSSLKCRPCSEDANQAKLQRRAANGVSCECMPNHRITSLKNGSITCDPCPENEVTSSDGWQCVRCSASNPFLNATQKCAACTGGISVELPDQGIQCLSCGDATRPDVHHKRCVRCPEDILQASNGTCECPKEKFMVSGGTCIPKSFSLAVDETWDTVTLENGERIKSQLLHDHLQAVIFQCKVLRNWTACQMLANLCVLSMYRVGSSKENSFPCDHYLKIATRESQRPVQPPDGVPSLFYLDGDAHLELSKTNVPNKFSLRSHSQFSSLKFVAALYSLQGHFLGMRNVTPDIQICRTSSEEVESGFIFGAQYQKKCKVNPADLWTTESPTFYELYLLSRKEGRQEMYPVPVLVKNLQKNDEYVNKESKQSKWQLTRRFFLLDPVSGLQLGDPSSMPTAKMLRYVRNLSIKIRVKDEEEGEVGSIYPPFLVVDYSEVTASDLLKNTKVTVSFSVSYEMAQSKTFYSIVVAVAVLSVLAVIWSLFQTWSWSRRAGKSHIDIQTLGKLLVFGSGNLANVFFLVVLCASVNWLVIFKRQDVVHLLLPTPEQEYPLVVYLGLAFTLKLLCLRPFAAIFTAAAFGSSSPSVLLRFSTAIKKMCLQIVHMLVVQSTIDIFFVDWERPRSSQKGMSNRSKPMRMVDETSIQIGEGADVPGVGSGTAKQPGSDKFLESGGGVSIWRTYFVSSTWADLQTLRRVRPGLQLFLLLCFLQVFGFENVTLADPRSTTSTPGNQAYTPSSVTCRFAIGASLFLTIAFVQYMIHRIVYERFFDDRLQQFIDLCSVSNISVFIVSLPRFGYYIHGRSAHGRADVNMKEMHEHLRREEEDLCGHRGLLPNTEQQTFCMALPEGLRDQYKRLLLPLTSYSQTADRMQGVGGRLARVDVERVVQTYQMVNRFLSGFIEHAFKDLDYSVKDHLLMENLLDVEFTEVQDKGIFYNDNSHSFDHLLFCGQECSLVIFEALLFSVVDLAAKDFTLAATFTYLFYKVIEAARKSAGRRNLVRKALVDERFLNS